MKKSEIKEMSKSGMKRHQEGKEAKATMHKSKMKALLQMKSK